MTAARPEAERLSFGQDVGGAFYRARRSSPSAPRHRKAELLQGLLAKQYHGALPTARISTR